MFENYNEYVNILGFTSFSFSLFVLVVWSVIWKGIALWKAARNTDKLWFIALLLINTVGILEILYIYVISKKKENNRTV